jgi:hypothetical protein
MKARVHDAHRRAHQRAPRATQQARQPRKHRQPRAPSFAIVPHSLDGLAWCKGGVWANVQQVLAIRLDPPARVIAVAGGGGTA